jgi:23S rRNA pseudouridine2605 synthase
LGDWDNPRRHRNLEKSVKRIPHSKRRAVLSEHANAASKASMTLDRVFSRFGLASRKISAEWIKAGRVCVNHRIERDAGRWIQPNRDRVELDGRELSVARRVYLMLNKPTGVITSFGDPQERDTVYDYLKNLDSWVFPIGRLDKDTSGLLLLTNDTDFGNTLTDPQSKIRKRYVVKVNARVTDAEICCLRLGVAIELGVITLPCGVKRLRETEKYSWLEMTLTEGKNRQIRRMIESLGHKVLKLVRVQIGHLLLRDLAVGKWRILTRGEVERLRNGI